MRKTVLIMIAAVVMAGCKTVRTSEHSVERERMETLMQRMDSVFNTRQTVQQDSSWREVLVREVQRISERNDTSRTVVVDTSGRVVKETTVIYRERESESERERQEREVIMHRLEQMDSTLNVMRAQLERSDSLLRDSRQETVVEKKEPWWKRIWPVGFLLGAGVGAAVVIGLRYYRNIRNKV